MKVKCELEKEITKKDFDKKDLLLHYFLKSWAIVYELLAITCKGYIFTK